MALTSTRRKPSAHAGITSSGAIAVPTVGSTAVHLKNGTFGTVDCSTVSYYQTIGKFGVNQGDSGQLVLTEGRLSERPPAFRLEMMASHIERDRPR